MFKIFKGGEYFFQWDLGQKLQMEEEFNTIHFCNQTEDCALVCETYVEDGVRLVNVPNILLQSTNNIRVYGCYSGDNTCYAKDYQIFRVIKRGKPESYIYTEDEVLNYTTLEKRIAELEAGSGGGGGNMRFVGVVDALPETANEGDIYTINSYKWVLHTANYLLNLVNCYMGSNYLDMYIYGDSGGIEFGDLIIDAIGASKQNPSPIKITNESGGIYIINAERYEITTNTSDIPPIIDYTFYGANNNGGSYIPCNDTIVNLYYQEKVSTSYIYNNGVFVAIS